MSLTDSQVKAQKAGPRRRNVSVGDSLILVIESESRGGGKSFEGRMRFPPGRKGKQIPVRIGVYGKGVGKWSLKQARDEQARLDLLRKAGEDPRLLKSESKRELIKQASTPSLIKAAEGFLERSKNKPSTV